MEIILNPRGPSLRSFSRHWPKVVAKANATILSQIHNDYCDAFLLSESSLFVYDHRLIMITCGTTSLVSAIEAVFGLIDLKNLQMLMFERKNENFPQAQPSDFETDVLQLRQHLPGETYRFGDIHGNHVSLFHYRHNFKPDRHDMTLEILMHDLSPAARRMFSGSSPNQIYEKTRIHRIFEGFDCDDYQFEPMGYSLNGIKGGEYYTVHVTPEEDGSYASFETNHVFEDDLGATIERIVAIFQPQSIALLFFDRRGQSLYQPSDYFLEKETSTRLCGFRIWFRNYQRALSKTETTTSRNAN